MEDPFDFQELRVRQPGKVAPGRASYRVFNLAGELLAIAEETEARSRLSVASGMQPLVRVLAVRTAAGLPILTMVQRDNDWTADLTAPGGEPLGRILIKDGRRNYTLLDSEGKVAAEVTGDLAVKNFSVATAAGVPFARVRKTNSGFSRLLTTADNYTVKFARPCSGLVRMLTVMMPIVLDIGRYE